MNPESTTHLLSEFTPPSHAEWRKAAEELLKGVPFEKALVTPTYEGFDLQPVYFRDALQGLPHLRDDLPGLGARVRANRAGGHRGGGWLISQELALSTPELLNSVILHELNNGQNELNLWLDAPGRLGLDPDDELARTVGICGTSVASLEDVRALLKGVHLGYISLFWRGGLSGLPLMGYTVQLAREQGVDARELRGCVDLDPLAFAVENGHLPGGLERAFDEMASATRYAQAKLPRWQTACVSGMVYANGGASSVQELAYVLASGVVYLRELEKRGISATQAAPHIRLCFGIGSQFFIEVAKFRAARLLWTRVLEAFGVPEDKRVLHLHARTGWWNKTTFDPYVNMLRVTTEAFSAVVGGVDSLTIGGFDETCREVEEFSRRIARNVHHILAEECDLAKVIDPAGGAYAVEALTDQVARLAWEKFQCIEKAGGMVQALTDGEPQKRVAETRAERKKAIARRKDTIVGINNYPNPQEKRLPARQYDYAGLRAGRVATIQQARGRGDEARKQAAWQKLEAAPAGSEAVIEAIVSAADAGASLQEISQALRREAAPDWKIERIALHRASEDYEGLRDKCAAIAERTGRRPQLLQANIGPSRKYRVRADWTSAFFQVGGFEVLNQDDFPDAAAAVAKAKATGAPYVVITSDDESYATLVEPLAQALKEAIPTCYVILAGNPADKEAAYRAAGVDEFVHVRVSAYDFNKKLLDRLG